MCVCVCVCVCVSLAELLNLDDNYIIIQLGLPRVASGAVSKWVSV